MGSQHVFNAKAMIAKVLTSCALLLPLASIADAADGNIFDELRFGATTSVASSHNGEDGVFPALTVYFDPFDSATAASFSEKLLRPRVHLGGEIGTEGSANTVYGGINWTIDLNDKIFFDVGFGGLWHDGNLRNTGSETGAQLGCRFLFREYAAVGYRINQNWNISTQIEHASHANLCDGPNDGITRAGLMLGYRF